MTWPDALEMVVARTKHARYRWLCSDENPSREEYRRLMVTLAEMPAAAARPVATTPPTEADLALREYLEKHGCGPCH